MSYSLYFGRSLRFQHFKHFTMRNVSYCIVFREANQLLVVGLGFMNQSDIIKTEDALSAPDLRNVKYSWLEDACIWLQYTHKMLKPREENYVLAGRSVGSIGIRLNSLHTIGKEIKLKGADLSDKENIRVWSAFVDHKFKAEDSVSCAVPTVHKKSVAALSKQLNLPFDALQSRLELIRNTKHFLYMSGIHFDEGDSWTEYKVTRQTNLTSNQSQLPIPIASRKRDDYTLSQLQALYRFKFGADQTNSIDDLSTKLNITLGNAKNCLANITERSTEAERIVKEGVTLLCGEDTDLWRDYIDKHVGPMHALEISLSTAVSAALATENNLKPMYTHFRLNLVRNLKKYLYIAGIHNDQTCGNEQPMGTSSSEASGSEKVPVQQGWTDQIATTYDVVPNLAVIDTLDDIIGRVEKNNHATEPCHTAGTGPELIVPVEATVIDSEAQPPPQGQSISLYSKPVTPLSTATLGDHIDRMITILESQAAADIQQTTTSSAHVGHDVAYSTDMAITKTSLRSNASTATTRISPNSTTVSTKRSVPKFASKKPSLVSTGVGKPYTMQDDRMIWQAWLTTNGFAVVHFGLEVKTSLATKLMRNQNGIDRRVDKLLIVREEANQAVHDGFTLLPDCKELQLWHAYSALYPPQWNDNSVYIHVPSAAKLADRNVLVNVIDDLQAIRCIKWFLNISGIHEEVSTTDPLTASVKLSPDHPTTSSISPKHSKASNTPNSKEHLQQAEQCNAELAELESPIAAVPESTLIATHTTTSAGIDLNDLTSMPNLFAAHFAFSLQHDADIWRAYLKSQMSTSHKPLPSRLQKLAGKLGCTFVQIKDRLSKLINLKIGLTEQCYSSGRPFTEAEDATIMAQLGLDGKSASTGDRLDVVAAQLRCSVGAVAVRSRQLKTLRIFDEARQSNQSAPSAAPLPGACTQHPDKILGEPEYTQVQVNPLLGKRPCPATDISTGNKLTRFDTDYVSNNADNDGSELSAHFSTEGEVSEGFE